MIFDKGIRRKYQTKTWGPAELSTVIDQATGKVDALTASATDKVFIEDIGTGTDALGVNGINFNAVLEPASFLAAVPADWDLTEAMYFRPVWFTDSVNPADDEVMRVWVQPVPAYGIPDADSVEVLHSATAAADGVQVYVRDVYGSEETTDNAVEARLEAVLPGAATVEMATTFGDTIPIYHNPLAATDTKPLYFDENGTVNMRFIADFTDGLDHFVETTGKLSVLVGYKTPGDGDAPVYCDEDAAADAFLQFVSPTTTDGEADIFGRLLPINELDYDSGGQLAMQVEDWAKLPANFFDPSAAARGAIRLRIELKERNADVWLAYLEQAYAPEYTGPKTQASNLRGNLFRPLNPDD